MGIDSFVISKDTTDEELEEVMSNFRKTLDEEKCVAFVVKKGALEYDGKIDYTNDNSLLREEIIEHIVKVSGEDPIVSTTGKASRELFEIRERKKKDYIPMLLKLINLIKKFGAWTVTDPH